MRVGIGFGGYGNFSAGADYLGYFYEDQIEVETIPTQSKKTLTEKTKEFIDACKTRAELKSWELMSKSNPELLEHYNKKLKSIK